MIYKKRNREIQLNRQESGAWNEGGYLRELYDDFDNWKPKILLCKSNLWEPKWPMYIPQISKNTLDLVFSDIVFKNLQRWASKSKK